MARFWWYGFGNRCIVCPNTSRVVARQVAASLGTTIGGMADVATKQFFVVDLGVVAK